MTQEVRHQSRGPHLIGEYLTPEYLAQAMGLPVEYVAEKLAQNREAKTPFRVTPLETLGESIEDDYALKGHFVYVVEWDDGVIKVGYASRRARWRTFVCRGAVLTELRSFATIQQALDAEDAAHDWLAQRLPPAFASRIQAVKHLGGGGHMECYQTEEAA